MQFPHSKSRDELYVAVAEATDQCCSGLVRDHLFETEMVGCWQWFLAEPRLKLAMLTSY